MPDLWFKCLMKYFNGKSLYKSMYYIHYTFASHDELTKTSRNKHHKIHR